MKQNPIILYVEDNLESREVMKLLIEDMLGWSGLTVFKDSADFINRAAALSPQPTLILLDIHVAPYTGFAMLKMLRNHPDFWNTPVIALTASVMSEEVQQLKEAGFNGIISKPIDIDAFPQTLQQILAGEASGLL